MLVVSMRLERFLMPAQHTYRSAQNVSKRRNGPGASSGAASSRGLEYTSPSDVDAFIRQGGPLVSEWPASMFSPGCCASVPDFRDLPSRRFRDILRIFVLRPAEGLVLERKGRNSPYGSLYDRSLHLACCETSQRLASP